MQTASFSGATPYYKAPATSQFGSSKATRAQSSQNPQFGFCLGGLECCAGCAAPVLVVPLFFKLKKLIGKLFNRNKSVES